VNKAEQVKEVRDCISGLRKNGGWDKEDIECKAFQLANMLANDEEFLTEEEIESFLKEK